MEFTGRIRRMNALESFLVPVYSVAPRALIPEKPEFFHLVATPENITAGPMEVCRDSSW